MSTTGTIFSGSGDAYDRFMGRYSTQLAPAFADFAGVAPGCACSTSAPAPAR